MILRKETFPEDILESIEIPLVEEIPSIWEEALEEKVEERNIIFSTQSDGEAIYPLSLEDISESSKEAIVEDEHVFSEDTDSIKTQEVQTENFKSIVTYEKKPHSIASTLGFILKYITTSSVIFAVLLLTTNFQAYYAIGYNLIFKEQMIQRQEGLLNSVEAGNVGKIDTSIELNSAKEEAIFEEKNFHSLENFVAKAQNQDVNLDITITPYENRIVIPKIGKNIPLLDVKEPKVSGLNELNNIFMKELENGVVRYPGSAKPGTNGNTFIFGHSSNFPWLDGDYNDVFALLDNVVFGDEIVVYYGQEKFIYKIYDKKVIKPGDVSILKKNTEHSEITLMTCWPIGTDLNRLVLMGELVTEK